jgi:hypothetical protein
MSTLTNGEIKFVKLGSLKPPKKLKVSLAHGGSDNRIDRVGRDTHGTGWPLSSPTTAHTVPALTILVVCHPFAFR